MDTLPKLPHQISVSQRPMPTTRAQVQPLRECVEPVPAFARKQGAGQPHRAQYIGIEADADLFERFLQEPVIKARVVRDKQLAIESAREFSGERIKCRCTADHRVRDTGQLLHKWRDRLQRIDQRAPAANAITVNFDHAHLGDAVESRAPARRLQIHKREWSCIGIVDQASKVGHGNATVA